MAFDNLISLNPENINQFYLFSASHTIAILSIITYAVLSSIIFKYTKLSKYEKLYRYLLIVIIIVQEASFKVWNMYIAGASLSENLSLHLCGMSLILMVMLLINKNEKLFELIYFWGLAGATQAILTPDLQVQYGFPHFRFIQFFLSHGLIIIVIVYMLMVEELRPGKGSIKRVFLITNAYAVIVGIINYLLGTNYLFIARKPDTTSLLDFLGPWPWYILSLEAIALISYFLVYSPFIFINFLHKNKMLNAKKHIEI